MKNKANISTKKKNLGKPMKNTRRKPRRKQMGGAEHSPENSSGKIFIDTLINLNNKKDKTEFLIRKFHLS